MQAYILLFRCPGKDPDGSDCKRPIPVVTLSPQGPLPDAHFQQPALLLSEMECFGCGWRGQRLQSELVLKIPIDWPS
jgi:hypothetical protein